MGLVIDGLFTVGLIIAVLWLWSLRGSLAGDKAEAERRRREAAQARERARREARLYRKGEPLRCLGCDHPFLGPLPPTGCPRCHLSALVVTEDDYRQGHQAAQANQNSNGQSK